MSYGQYGQTQHTGERIAGGSLGAPHRTLFVRLALATLFLLSSFPLGTFWFCFLVTMLSVGLGLIIVWVGLPILALALLACFWGSAIERWRIGALLGTPLPSPLRPLPRDGSVFARVRARATDASFWHALLCALLYLLLLFPVGVVELVIGLVLLSSVAMVSYPLWFWTLSEESEFAVISLGRRTSIVADTWPEALLVMLAGVVLLTVGALLVLGAAWLHAALGRVLLGPSGREMSGCV